MGELMNEWTVECTVTFHKGVLKVSSSPSHPVHQSYWIQTCILMLRKEGTMSKAGGRQWGSEDKTKYLLQGERESRSLKVYTKCAHCPLSHIVKYDDIDPYGFEHGWEDRLQNLYCIMNWAWSRTCFLAKDISQVLQPHGIGDWKANLETSEKQSKGSSSPTVLRR